MRDRCRIPSNALMDDRTVHQPCHAVPAPVDGVPMEAGARVESEIDPTRRSAIAEAHRGPIVAGIEIDVGQHSPGNGSWKLNVDLLERSVAMQEECGNESRAGSRAYLCLKAPVPKGTHGCEGSGPVGPQSAFDRLDREARAFVAVLEVLSRERREVSRKRLDEARKLSRLLSHSGLDDRPIRSSSQRAST